MIQVLYAEILSSNRGCKIRKLVMNKFHFYHHSHVVDALECWYYNRTGNTLLIHYKKIDKSKLMLNELSKQIHENAKQKGF